MNVFRIVRRHYYPNWRYCRRKSRNYLEYYVLVWKSSNRNTDYFPEFNRHAALVEWIACPRISTHGPSDTMCEAFMRYRIPWNSRLVVPGNWMPLPGFSHVICDTDKRFLWCPRLVESTYGPIPNLLEIGPAVWEVRMLLICWRPLLTSTYW